MKPEITSPLPRAPAYTGGETGLQWLPLQVPGNVRIIVTATHPDPNYLQIHEQKMRQHMANPDQALLLSQSSGASNGGKQKAVIGSSGGAGSIGRGGGGGQQSVEKEGEGEAEYESSHRRRKVISY